MAFAKRITIERAEPSTQTVVGAVMEPNRVDRQGDFATPETIESLSQGFMRRLSEGHAESGVMHAVFNGDDLSYVENRVLEEAAELGESEYPAGTWVVGMQIHNEQLFSLVEDDGLNGFSIGGEMIESETYEPDELPEDVTVPESATVADSGIRELVDAEIMEISLVDQPAVDRAQIQVAKSDLLKVEPALTESFEHAVQYLRQRGHSEEIAQRMAEYLIDRQQKHADVWDDPFLAP